MKKIVFTASLLVSLGLSLVGCKQELQEARGVVTDMEFDSDTLLCTRIAVDGDTLLFKVNEVLSVLPKAPHVIEPTKESNDSLVTRPVKDQEPEQPVQPQESVQP